nr:MAG TPA: hypothetical protein [Caudoviricetes sp.]
MLDKYRLIDWSEIILQIMAWGKHFYIKLLAKCSMSFNFGGTQNDL